MPRFLIEIVVNLITAAVALLVTSLLVSGVTVEPAGFIAAGAIFVLSQTILGPFVFNMARKHAPAIMGGIGLVSTLLALFLATLFGGLTITGAGSWALAVVIVWFITALGGWAVLAYWMKRRAQGGGSGDSSAAA